MAIISAIISSILIFVLANCFTLADFFESSCFTWVLLLLPFYILLNVFPGPWFVSKKKRPSNQTLWNRRRMTKRLQVLGDGSRLLILFLISVTMSVLYGVMGFLGSVPYMEMPSLKEDPKFWIINTVFVVLVEAVVFWNGIIRVYVTSGQLGVRWRVLGIICGWIPPLNIIMLGFIIRLTLKEVSFEDGRLRLDESRKDEQLCKTKYPILLVHGVFFRDFRYLNYWGRVPRTLESNGAEIYYGNHQSAASVADCGQELADRIKQIIKETGCEKVNIIAHSKGGLDSRYALAKLGVSEYVASLTTINTPHRGCEFADYLLHIIPEKEKQLLAATYNAALKKLGDPNPDFLAAVGDLTATACERMNEEILNAEGVYYQSVGSKLNVARSGRFPLNFTYHLVNSFDGANDGLVGEASFPWGENFQFLTVKGKRGISHGDMIDLNRENIDAFDVREFYVQLVNDLKRKGF